MDKAQIVFEKIAKKRSKKHSWEKTIKSLFAGSVAGASSATVVAPLDLAKGLHKNFPKEYKGLSTIKTLKKVYIEGGKGLPGIREMWRGNLKSVGKLGAAGAVSFAVYSALNNQLKKVKL